MIRKNDFVGKKGTPTRDILSKIISPWGERAMSTKVATMNRDAASVRQRESSAMKGPQKYLRGEANNTLDGGSTTPPNTSMYSTNSNK